MALPDGTLITVYQPNSVGYYDSTTVAVADLASAPPGSYIYAYASNSVGGFNFQQVLVSDIGDLPEGSEAWVQEPNGVGWYDPALVATTELVSSYAGPLDIVPGAVVALSQRAMTAAWVSNAITIREDAGDTTMSFPTTANNAVDVAAVATFLGGAGGFVTAWLDQSGNGINLAQATIANQPEWVASALNSKPGMLADAADMGLLSAGFSFAGGEVYLTCVVDFSDLSGLVYVLDLAGGDSVGRLQLGIDYNVPGDVFVGITSIADWASSQTIATGACIIEIMVAADGEVSALVNGTELTMTVQSGIMAPLPADPAKVVRFPSVDGPLFEALEAVVYNSIPSAPDRLLIRQNIATYYGIELL